MSLPKVKIFIGSGEQSVLERKVLIYSLHKHTKRELDIAVFNGTHNAVETEGAAPQLAPLPLHLKYRNMTEFSLYRYLIPELTGFAGRAIYLDSDMICLRDIGDLFDTSLDGADFLAKREYADTDGAAMWALSVMLIDNERCRFDLETIFKEIDEDVFTYRDFSQMGTRFLSQHHYQIGELDPNWNVFDRCDDSTKLIHYTHLYTQPWKFLNHPFGEIWFEYLREAQAAGYVTERDIDLAILRGYARPDLRDGNSRSLIQKLRALVRSR